jgi:hypothetical protein
VFASTVLPGKRRNSVATLSPDLRDHPKHYFAERLDVRLPFL